MKKRFLVLLLSTALILVLIMIDANTTNNSRSNKIKIAASFYPLYNFAQEVGGNKVRVTNVTPAGAEPHDYEPSPRQLINAQQSQIFIYDGGTMEPWISKFLPDYQHIVVKASKGISLQAGQDENGVISTKIQDPHFWLDPVLAEQIIANIQNGLVKARPADKKYFEVRAKIYEDKLAKLDKEYRQGLSNCKFNTIITSHAAFGYLAKEYNFKALSIAGISPDQEPSPAKLAELSQLVKKEGIKYIFFERLTSPRLADTIAKETGAKTIVFDPIEGLSQSEQKQGKDYLSIQRENLSNLKTALSCH